MTVSMLLKWRDEHHLTQRKSKPMHAGRSASLDLFSRPSTLVDQHQKHQLSDIVEASLSSRYSTLNNGQSLQALKDGGNDDVQALHENAPIPPPHTSNDVPPEVAVLSEINQSANHTRWASRAMSTISLPLCEIPERRSSVSNFNQHCNGSGHASLHENMSIPAKSNGPVTCLISGNGKADSPVRNSLARGTQSSEGLRKSPSRTFIRTTPVTDILDNGMIQHPRFSLSTRIPSPLFVGGGTIEGQLELHCDQNAKKARTQSILISKLSVDVLGVEELSDGKRHIFLALAVELFDAQHPPPTTLVVSQTPVKGSELLWETKPSKTKVPFCINLPLSLGPPPYVSKFASIRYLLCPSVHIKIGNKRSVVRQSWQCQMLTVHDPEKALGSLPSPLIASDTLTIAQSPGQSIKLTAGLHRQTWINGSALFADLHIVNSSTRVIKRIDLQLEKNTLIYAHAAAGTVERSASHLRLPKRNETEVVSTMVVKKSQDWRGVLPQSSEVRTCELEIPRGHVTIASGRYFEVRYFVRVLISLNLFKSLAVQLPVTIIHINSLDILPNSLAQVAASIEAKRTRTLPISYDGPSPLPFFQGQAFEAARRQSLERGRMYEDDTPLAHPETQTPLGSISNSKHTSDAPGMKNLPSNEKACSSVAASHHHHRRHPSCYHCQLTNCDAEKSQSPICNGPRLPRLQVSTSGLGFSESEFEIPPDSPKKVMLSEEERKMIRQQRELKLQRQWSVRSEGKDHLRGRKLSAGNKTGFLGYRNVASLSVPVIPHEISSRLSMSKLPSSGRVVASGPKPMSSQATPNRKRSKTNPDVMRPTYRRPTDARTGGMSAIHSRQEVKSMDRGRRRPMAAYMSDDEDVFYDARASHPPGHMNGTFAMHRSRAV